jgi:hypothetical protein
MKLSVHRLRFAKKNELIGLLVITCLGFLLLYRLGALIGGLSNQEIATAVAPVGWHGIYQDAFNLPLKLVRSFVFFISPGHGQTLTRLPNVLFGWLAISAFFWLIRVWHGWRTAFFSTALFATGAWTLHISRLASFDVLYLCALPLLLLANLGLHRKPGNPVVLFGSMLLWGSLLYIPGLVWLVALNIYWQWEDILSGWKELKDTLRRSLYVLSGLIWLPLLIIQLSRATSWQTWLGLPAHLPNVAHFFRHLLEVLLQLFVRGPNNSELWLAKAPVLDIFTLVMCGLGIYFYASHVKAFRARMLASYFVLGVILISLGGSVGLSLLVPLLYIAAAAGIAYLLHDWLRVFPRNPLARGLGIGLVCLAVALASTYNLRAYFVAWPHNPAAHASFRNRR